MDNYLVHYHIYKNAGSSVDKAIRSSFGADTLLELDKDARYKHNEYYDENLIKSIIESGGEYKAFSSHKMTPTVHLSEEYNFLPIVHVRHPLLRAASVYRYERKRADEKPGKEFAREFEFPEWLNWSLNTHQYIESRNYQAILLSIPDVAKGEPAQSELNIDRVLARLESIPVVGVVEYFNDSCKYYEAYMNSKFPEFRLNGAHSNKTKEVADWKEELKVLTNSLPRETVLEFEEKNALDYELFWNSVKRLRELNVSELAAA